MDHNQPCTASPSLAILIKRSVFLKDLRSQFGDRAGTALYENCGIGAANDLEEAVMNSAVDCEATNTAADFYRSHPIGRRRPTRRAET